MLIWQEDRIVGWHDIAPCKSMQNALVEGFAGSFRGENPNETLFMSLATDREKITAWASDYNRHRPPASLGIFTPQELAQKSGRETKAA